MVQKLYVTATVAVGITLKDPSTILRAEHMPKIFLGLGLLDVLKLMLRLRDPYFATKNKLCDPTWTKIVDCTEIGIQTVSKSAGRSPLSIVLSVTRLYGAIIQKGQTRWQTFELFI